MIDAGKRNVLGVLVDAVDYDGAVQRISTAARQARSCTVSALAVHGVMTGVLDAEQRYRLNRFDLVVPDGQPVRWAMNRLYRESLPDQVRGTALTLRVLRVAADEGLPVYLYGSTPAVLAKLRPRLEERFPSLVVAGCEPSRFASIDRDAQAALAERVRASGARLALIGLGCPRQEVFVYALGPSLGMPALAVGAAFDYLAGGLREPPDRMRKAGLEWAWRFALEPRRLWRRYLLLNPAYLALFALQRLGLWRPSGEGDEPGTLEGIDG